jgi:hypothetical protein
MSPHIHPDLIGTTDYLHSATAIYSVVCGRKGEGWSAHVRGRDPDDGAHIGVAWYELDYERKADATKRARQLLAHVRALRQADPS